MAQDGVGYEIEPFRRGSVTAVYVHKDYLLDQLYWLHAPQTRDRLAARHLIGLIYEDPVQILSFGRGRATLLAPYLDELVHLTGAGSAERDLFLRQSLWFKISHLLNPFVQINQVEDRTSQEASGTSPTARKEATVIARLLTEQFARFWSTEELAAIVYLSPVHLRRVFVATYGITPRAYLIERRVEYLAFALCETTLTIAEASRAAGWSNSSNANRHFRAATGMSMSEYRRRRGPGSRFPGAETDHLPR
ncbi:AraC family transcriptional regulator [Leucobacter allii]|uniref:helix-turn-helix domain-containing protein n=1 Tax=Leucobacter allii TaxID=2932247 RepID=UPI001FCFD260|nr:AraC family transcriptional regulator [Leucobacter allii]UOR02373.1 AraC family transcriptional regulator [Leucobacter allii]